MFDKLKLALKICQILLLLTILGVAVKNMLGIELVMDNQTQIAMITFAACMSAYLYAEMCIRHSE